MTAAYIVLAAIGGLFLISQAGGIALGYMGVGDYPQWLENQLLLSPSGSRLRCVLRR